MHTLTESLARAGLSTIALAGKVLVLPHSARVLGLSPQPDANLLWVDPLLSEPDRLAASLSSPGWLNLGGDRTWISPEVETLVRDMNRFPESIEVPESVDPGNYAVAQQHDE